MISDIILTTLINGSTWALLAIGFSLIFGVARIVNIAHTAFYMVAAYCIFYGTHRLGVHPVLAALMAIIFVMVLGLICYKLFIEPIREHEAAVLEIRPQVQDVFIGQDEIVVPVHEDKGRFEKFGVGRSDLLFFFDVNRQDL